VSTWLMPSMGLPVAMTTGRLVVRTLSWASGYPIGVLTAVTGCALMLALGCASLVGNRRRRASRHESIS